MTNSQNERNTEKNKNAQPLSRKSNFPKDYWDFLFRSSEVHETDTHSVVLNYLLQPGYEEIAEEFFQEANFTSNIPPGMIKVKRSLRGELDKNNFDGAKELLNSISPQFLEKNETLSFMLNLQELVKLIIQKKTLEAIEFARNHMKSFVSEKKPHFIRHLENAMSLLAYDDFKTGQAKEILNQLDSLSSDIMELIYNAIFEFYKINKEPILHILLKDVLRSEKKIETKMNIIPPKLNEFETGKLKLSTNKTSDDTNLSVWFSKSTMIQHQQIHDETILVTQSNNLYQLSQRYPNDRSD